MYGEAPYRSDNAIANQPLISGLINLSQTLQQYCEADISRRSKMARKIEVAAQSLAAMVKADKK
jgi:hypothetical protein